MKNRKLIFFGSYPIMDEEIEGMRQRILAVDEEFKEYPRVYLDISLKKYFKKIYLKKDNIEIYRLNLIKHYFLIKKLLKTQNWVYGHSLLSIFPLLFFKTNFKSLTLDIHGTVPEELKFNNSIFKSKFASVFEKRIFKKITYAIAVSNQMIQYYKKKYKFDIHYILKPIYPKNLYLENVDNENEIKKDLGIKDENIFIYSGGISKWQNIDLTIKLIEDLDENCYVIFLTPNVKEIKEKISNYNLKCKIFINQVSPEEIHKYYRIANYGFILRDDHILNNVAAPTKLIEYLKFGIIPIMKTKKIGDIQDYNIEYIDYDKKLNNLKRLKSNKNIEIANTILERNNNIRLRDILIN